jgi:hypothetical protein
MSTTPTTCPRCSRPFECGIDTGACWCADVEVKPAVRAALAQYYDGCLCRACLEAIEEERPQAPSVWSFLRSQLGRKRDKPGSRS